MLIVGLALAPLALASIAQGILHVRARQDAIDQVLRQTADYATHNEQNIFTETNQFLRDLAARPELKTSPADCHRALATAMIGNPNLVNVTLIDAQGKPLCTAAAGSDEVDYRQLRWWKVIQTRDKPLVGHQLYSSVLKRNVLPMTLALRDAKGKFSGALSAALDLRWVSQTMPYGRLPKNALMVIIDPQGMIVASNRPVPKGLSARILKDDTDGKEHTFSSDAGGARWRWTAAPVPNSNKTIAFGMIEPLPFGMTRIYLIGDVLLPILMVVLATIAMWLGTERFVIRWTTYLTRVSAAYAQNHFALELRELEDASDEFKTLGYEMKSMANSIRDRDRTLSAALQQKSLMAREIHHRVKNNLQIVSSLISIYSQNITDRDARMAFAHILTRVGALTLIQRLMERNETEPILDMRVLFTEMAEEMRSTAAEQGVRYQLSVNIEDWLLPPDMATPVVFFAVEALSFELFATDPTGALRNVTLQFGGDGPGFLRLTIEDGVFGNDAMQTGKPSPDKIFRALAEQLKGTYWVDRLAYGRSRLVLRLPVHSGTQGPAIRISAQNGVASSGENRAQASA